MFIYDYLISVMAYFTNLNCNSNLTYIPNYFIKII